MIYLSIPYTGQTGLSFHVATHVAAELTKRCEIVYSPITHSHPMAEVAELPQTWEFWEKIDREFIKRCDQIWIINMPGVKKSVGVQAEIKIADEYGLKIRNMNVLESVGGSLVIHLMEIWTPIRVPAYKGE